MLSEDRTIFGTTIRQETKTGFLSINDLQAAYEAARFEHGWTEKRIEHITRANDFVERAYYVIDNQRVINTPNGVFMGSADNQVVTFPTSVTYY
jgi:hypothetical protein